MHLAFHFWLMLLVSIVAGSNGHLTVAPENKATLHGTVVILKCFTNNSSQNVFWKIKEREDKIPEKLSTGSRVSPNLSNVYRVNNSVSGQYDLIVNTSLGTGRRYICEQGSFGLVSGNFGSIELIVLESEPKCVSDVLFTDNDGVITIPVNNSLEMRCSVNYSGNWEPMTEWKEQISVFGVYYQIERIELNGSVFLNTILNITNATTAGNKYVYELSFEESRRPNSTTAKNIPDFRFKWTSPIIRLAVTEIAFLKPSIIDIRIAVLLVILSIVAVLLISSLLKFAIERFIRNRRRIALDIIREASGTQDRRQNYNNCVQENVNLYDVPSPPYAAVSIRGRQLAESSHHPREFNHNSTEKPSIYSEVFKPSRVEQSPEFSNAVLQRKMIGADGTEYARLQSPSNGAVSSRHLACQRKELYERSDYAEIDHTATSTQKERHP